MMHWAGTAVFGNEPETLLTGISDRGGGRRGIHRKDDRQEALQLMTRSLVRYTTTITKNIVRGKDKTDEAPLYPLFPPTLSG